MTRDAHIARHKALHAALDELFADYIGHHKDQMQFTQMPIIDLLNWSKDQCENPTETPA
jgi:hypothetical protein